MKDLENLQTFGFRGEGISNIIESSRQVEIISRYCQSSQTFRKSFFGTNSKSLLEHSPQKRTIGTSVTVKNLFANFPVRQKQLKSELCFEEAKEIIEKFALIFPQIAFSLYNSG